MTGVQTCALPILIGQNIRDNNNLINRVEGITVNAAGNGSSAIAEFNNSNTNIGYQDGQVGDLQLPEINVIANGSYLSEDIVGPSSSGDIPGSDAQLNIWNLDQARVNEFNVKTESLASYKPQSYTADTTFSLNSIDHQISITNSNLVLHLSEGQQVYLDFSGDTLDGYYTINSISGDTFTVDALVDGCGDILTE